MKVSGFSFVKNAILYDYPVVESIRSVLPICDEFVIAIGKCEDGTLELIKAMNEPKLKIIETVWDENLREGGRVLAVETDKAFQHISGDVDWAFYIQGDEVIHETDLIKISMAMARYKDHPKVDGLLFKYRHFYGSYDYVGTSSNWYTHEIRVVKNKASIYSYGDAQGFRKETDEKLQVVPIDAYVNHYGWVRPPDAMLRKQTNFGSLYRGPLDAGQPPVTGKFDYEKHVREVALFKGRHPKVMQQRIANKNWVFKYDISMSNKSLKDRFKGFLKRYLGIKTYYRNYKLIKGEL